MLKEILSNVFKTIINYDGSLALKLMFNKCIGLRQTIKNALVLFID